ncbi:glucuronyl hydrolase [Pseudomonas sp. NBRC 100443]|uniref:glucuronyl hydrolase n=1 Tax=Pseudomonas sp. NBRC 100443 TaxID=1113665 RepID=UPI0024A2A8B4|nr:glucuronyl hydrolase [Pseudomonas sp. NBRC 100443]GLU39958.1 hypothetical protein Pssp01_40510 [Pseudomonas sp. NBRC 100443]
MQGVDLYQTAIHAIFKRMDEIAAQCGDRFPLFRPDVATQWKLSRRGSWLGGFWAGLWWRRAAYTRSADDHAVARTWSAQLQPLLSEPSINRSFVFWYGAAIGHQVFAKDQAAQQLAGHAALAISASFDPVWGCWTSGPGMGAGEPGTRTLNVDALAPTLALLHSYGGPKGRVQAHQHLQTCLRYLATEHGAWRENVVPDIDDDMRQEEAGTWPRGQAWAMLGMAEAVRLYGDVYRQSALQACAYWTEHWGSSHESAEPTKPPIPQQDLSARVISALAMLKLSQCAPDQHWLCQQAHTQISSVLDASNVAEAGQFVGHLYRVGPDDEQLVESACATFFLLENLLSLQSSVLIASE